MSANFDPHELDSWFFGPMTRQEAVELLQRETEPGVFLVRTSHSIEGGYVLCVREESRVSHYIVNKLVHGSQTGFKIGNHVFPDMPQLLLFYTMHCLDTVPLRRPAVRTIEGGERVRAQFDFNGSGDVEDLPFRKGEILTVISKGQSQWWTARNSMGLTGQIPVNYIERLDETGGPLADSDSNLLPTVIITPAANNDSPPKTSLTDVAVDGCDSDSTCGQILRRAKPHLGGRDSGSNSITHNRAPSPRNGIIFLNDELDRSTPSDHWGPTQNHQHRIRKRQLPAKARVKQARVPSAYDKTALRLEIGDTILVTATHRSGQWEGEILGSGRAGHFPFTHVEFLDSDDTEDADYS